MSERQPGTRAQMIQGVFTGGGVGQRSGPAYRRLLMQGQEEEEDNEAEEGEEER